ncbi:MAG TPA: YciI family protein [Thermoanaerobaculia bacterium]|nr:YciI family protein [Thermoanaerobaculia bacterium]
MRFMVLMIPGNKNVETGAMPDDKTIAAMMKFNEELSKAGVLLALDGLHPTSKGARVRFAGGKRTVTDGPFTEAREVIGGFWLWQVKSKEEAIEWASRCPAEEGDVLEIRQVYEASDFGPEVAAKEAELLGEIGKRAEENRERAAR